MGERVGLRGRQLPAQVGHRCFIGQKIGAGIDCAAAGSGNDQHIPGASQIRQQCHREEAFARIAGIPREVTVVMIEHVRAQGSRVEVLRAVGAGENVVRQGSEARSGNVVLRRGRRLAAAGGLAFPRISACVHRVLPIEAADVVLSTDPRQR